jgi:hypothetical protein
MSDPAIERLNYFNGQRLEAGDFRLEQDYYINVRRWLNRALFTPGIAVGLEVSVKTGDAHTVLVDPGLALDALGREIILVDQVSLAVTGLATNPGDPVVGNYLVIEYAEEAVSTIVDGCPVRLTVPFPASEDITWGAPSRILAQPKLGWQNQWPKLDPKKPEDYKIVLAQVELDNSCAVRSIRAFVRQYVGALQPDRVRALSIEGEKDIDSNNPKELHFHIEGGHLDRAALYLQGAKFSTLYYTQLGEHQHKVSVSTQNATVSLNHAHDFGPLNTESSGTHDHQIKASVAGTDTSLHGIRIEKEDTPSVSLTPIAGGRANMEVVKDGSHIHALAKSKTSSVDLPHTHPVTGNTDKTGVNAGPLSTAALAYVNALRIAFDGLDITGNVLALVTTMTQLGDGTPGHAFITDGTGEIDLRRIAGVDLSPTKPHTLTFSVGAGGGKIHYNLYIG